MSSLETTLNLGFVWVNTGFLGAPISNVILKCRQYSYNILQHHHLHRRYTPRTIFASPMVPAERKWQLLLEFRIPRCNYGLFVIYLNWSCAFNVQFQSTIALIFFKAKKIRKLLDLFIFKALLDSTFCSNWLRIIIATLRI